MSDPRCQVEILIHVDGSMYASRYWPQVPRKGDGIMLNMPGGERFQAVVEAVIWDETGNTSTSATTRPTAYLYTKRVIVRVSPEEPTT